MVVRDPSIAQAPSRAGDLRVIILNFNDEQFQIPILIAFLTIKY
jgi:hypothetical protein